MLNFLIFSLHLVTYSVELIHDINPSITVKIFKSERQIPNYLIVNDQWSTFGPLKLNIIKKRKKGNKFIFQAYNSQNSPIYLAINCSSKKINVTTKNLVWKGWFEPERGFEVNMINEICKSN